MTRKPSNTLDNFFTSLPTATDVSVKSKKCSDRSADLLPPYLNNTEPLEPEDQGLQLALVTMEIASIRHKMAALSRAFTEMAKLVNPDLFMGSFGDG